MPLLRELYACYNGLSDINDLYYNNTIEVLDLEGNDIEDMEAIGVLETMDKLISLNICNNPVTTKNKNLK